MRNSVLLLALVFCINPVFAQQVVSLEEGKPVTENGLEYSYYISNGSSKEVKGEDYDRYELNLSVSNKAGCIKLVPLRNARINSTGTESSQDDILVAEFNCINATGKRLTAKKGTVSARPWYTNVRVPDETTKDKYKVVNAMAGYAIRNGQTITNKIIVIVPKGERPKLNCRIIYLADL